jgi:hypothetical protein
MGWEIGRSGAGVAIGLRDRAAYTPAQILFALAIAARRSAAAGLTDRSTRGFSSSRGARIRSIIDRLHQPTSTVGDRSSSNSTPFFPLMIFFALAGLGLATVAVQRRSIRR